VEYVWKEKAGERRLYGNGSHIASIPQFEREGIRAVDDIRVVGDGVFRWSRRFTAEHPIDAGDVSLTMDLVGLYQASYCMIPAVSYDGNRWGSGLEPKGYERAGVPWTFASHRTAIAGATYSEGGAWSLALFGDAPDDGVGFACSLLPSGNRTTHRLIWPEMEQPAVYCRRDEYQDGFRASLALEVGVPFVATAYIVAEPVSEPRAAWRKLLDVAWEQNHRPQPMPFTPREVWDLGIRFAARELWAEERPFRGFSIGLQWDGHQWFQRRHYKYEAGWAGQNISLANALLVDYLHSGNKESLEKGIATLDTWVAHARLERGLFRCVFDPILGERTENEVQDACNLGTAAEHFFEAYELAVRCGLDKPAYRDVARGICDFAVSQQQEDGKLGKSWANDGRCLDPNGTIGAFLVPPLIVAHQVTDEAVYLAAAEKAYGRYIADFMRDGYTTAGALDTHCVDKESCYPLLTAGLALHALTGRDEYLRWAEHAAYYLSTWQWHHTVRFRPDSVLATIGYETLGGTAVSTQHHHLDPFAARFAPQFLRLAELTGKEVWKQRGLAAWANGLYGLSDGNLQLGEVAVPAGGQPEGFFHTRWLDWGGVSMWLVAWPTAFRLETLRRLGNWSLLEG